MATLIPESGNLVLRLARWEKLGSFHGDLTFPITAVQDVDVSQQPFREIRGLRAPGTGVPGRVALGTWRYRGGKDFVAVYRGQPAVVVRLRDAPFRRLVVSSDDADALATAIRSAI